MRTKATEQNSIRKVTYTRKFTFIPGANSFQEVQSRYFSPMDLWNSCQLHPCWWVNRHLLRWEHEPSVLTCLFFNWEITNSSHQCLLCICRVPVSRGLNHLNKFCFISVSSSVSIKTSCPENTCWLHKQVPAGISACDSIYLPYHRKLSPRWWCTKVLLFGGPSTASHVIRETPGLITAHPPVHQAAIIPSYSFVKRLDTKSCLAVSLHPWVAKETARKHKKNMPWLWPGE